MLTPCPTDDRKMQLFANFVLVFLKMSGFCNTFSLLFFKFFCFSVNNTPCTHKGQTVRCVLATFHCLRYRRLRPSKALQTFFTLLVTVCQLSLRFFKLFYFSVNNTPCTHEGQTVRCVLATFHCLKYGRLRPSKALQTFLRRS